MQGSGGASVGSVDDGDLGDLGDLGPITRILLATDGGITHILEAYAGETVELVTLASSVGSDRHALDTDHDPDGRTLRRRTLLRGGDSERLYVHADSAVRLDRLPPSVAEGLSAPEARLLPLLAQHRIGTFRESVREWQGTDESMAGCFGIEPGEVLVARTYQVVLGGRPLAWVTETFPRNGFSRPRSPACRSPR